MAQINNKKQKEINTVDTQEPAKKPKLNEDVQMVEDDEKKIKPFVLLLEELLNELKKRGYGRFKGFCMEQVFTQYKGKRYSTRVWQIVRMENFVPIACHKEEFPHRWSLLVGQNCVFLKFIA
jgi:hypothetical protein